MGAEDGTRTRDPRITNALLYQLSHFGIICSKAGAKIVYFPNITKFFAKNLSFRTQITYFYLKKTSKSSNIGK